MLTLTNDKRARPKSKSPQRLRPIDTKNLKSPSTKVTVDAVVQVVTVVHRAPGRIDHDHAPKHRPERGIALGLEIETRARLLITTKNAMNNRRRRSVKAPAIEEGKHTINICHDLPIMADHGEVKKIPIFISYLF